MRATPNMKKIPKKEDKLKMMMILKNERRAKRGRGEKIFFFLRVRHKRQIFSADMDTFDFSLVSSKYANQTRNSQFNTC